VVAHLASQIGVPAEAYFDGEWSERTQSMTAVQSSIRGFEAAGRMHILLAPTTKAVEAIRREIPNARVTTVESFLLSQKARGTGAIGVLGKLAYPRLKDAVITVDEWGLLSNRAGHELLG
jgi:hypothetical protein